MFVQHHQEKHCVEGEKQISVSSAVLKLDLHHGALMKKGES